MLMATLRPRKCKHCRARFQPARPGQIVHEECVEAHIQKLIAKRQSKQNAEHRARKRVERAMDKKREEAIETIPELIKAADKAFQAFIRARDRQAGHLCISSGRPLDWNAGNKVDAGHYRSKGAASHLRYNEDNCHAQTKEQNRFKAGNAVDYRVNLINRIGLARVEALECDNAPTKWTKDGLRAIRATYAAKLKEIKRSQS